MFCTCFARQPASNKQKICVKGSVFNNRTLSKSMVTLLQGVLLQVHNNNTEIEQCHNETKICFLNLLVSQLMSDGEGQI